MIWVVVALSALWFVSAVCVLSLCVRAKAADNQSEALERDVFKCDVFEFCNHPYCKRPATIKMDVNGKKRQSCERHVGELVRGVYDSSFEALGVSE